MKWQYLQLEKWLQKGYNPYCLRETKSEKEVPRCFLFPAILIATLLAAPSGRFSAGSAVSAANRIRAALRNSRAAFAVVRQSVFYKRLSHFGTKIQLKNDAFVIQ